MTVKQLLEMTAEELEKFSDAEAEEWFRPMFPTTRPQQTTGNSHASKATDGPIKRVTQSKKSEKAALLQKTMDIAKQYGIELKL